MSLIWSLLAVSRSSKLSSGLESRLAMHIAKSIRGSSDSALSLHDSSLRLFLFSP